MKSVMLPVLLFVSVQFAFSQMPKDAETTWVVASPQSGGVTSCVQHFSIGNMVGAPGPCVEKVYTTGAINGAMTSITTKIDGLNAEVSASVDKKFSDLTPKLLEQVNGAVAKGSLTKPQIEKLKTELHAQLTSELTVQLDGIKKELDTLKAEIELLKGK